MHIFRPLFGEATVPAINLLKEMLTRSFIIQKTLLTTSELMQRFVLIMLVPLLSLAIDLFIKKDKKALTQRNSHAKVLT